MTAKKTSKKPAKKTIKVVAETPAETNGLESRAMLVDLSIGFWDGRRKDNDKSKEVTEGENAERDAGAWWTAAVPKSSIKPIVNARIRARVIHQGYTMPWQDNGARVLPAAMFLDYTAAMRKAEAEYRTTVDAFLAEYPALVASARQRLGGLFKPEFFPAPHELTAKFPWTLRFNPLPTAGDFRVDLGGDTTDEIRKGIQAEADKAMANAMSDLWERLHVVVTKIAERLNEPEAKFRDSLIGNAAELCELLPRMNVTNDPNLEKLRAEVVAKLAGANPETLRENPVVRADAAKAANDILEAMRGFMPAPAGE